MEGPDWPVAAHPRLPRPAELTFYLHLHHRRPFAHLNPARSQVMLQVAGHFSVAVIERVFPALEFVRRTHMKIRRTA